MIYERAKILIINKWAILYPSLDREILDMALDASRNKQPMWS